MENYKNPLFSLCITYMMGLFIWIVFSSYLKGVGAGEQGEKVPKLLGIFKYFFTLKVFDAFNKN